jgi:hypothetical protein
MPQMGTRQFLKDGPTKWFSFRLPDLLYETLRKLAYSERKSIALVIHELLVEALAMREKKEGRDEGHTTVDN